MIINCYDYMKLFSKFSNFFKIIDQCLKLFFQVVQALAFGTHIVNLKYWRAVLQSVENNAELPEVSSFTPSIEEGLINKESVSLKINPERKVLFKNLCFVCFSPSQYQLKDIIQCAGTG